MEDIKPNTVFLFAIENFSDGINAAMKQRY
jgi:hypothetical protein